MKRIQLVAIKHMIKPISGLFLLLIVSSKVAFANEPLCDMRKIALTPTQKEALREIRLQNRQYARQTTPSSQQVNEYNRKVRHLLKQDRFDVNQAKYLIQEKYRLPAQRDLEQLSLLFSLIQVLNPSQKDEWLEKCTY